VNKTGSGQSQAFLKSVIQKSINHKQTMTEKEFLEACSKNAALLLRNQQTYKVVFPIWPKSPVLSGRRLVRSVVLNHSPSVNSSFFKKCVSERSRLAADLSIHDDYLRNFDRAEGLPLTVSTVKAINSPDAFEQSETAISIILGLYSRYIARGQNTYSPSIKKPINGVLLGPFMTVHRASGELESDSFWYEDWPEALTQTRVDADQISELGRKANALWERTKKSKWREQAETALIRYYKAFSIADGESSFLEAWRLLEYVGGTETTKYDDLVRRAAFFFDHHTEMREVGRHLMVRRNAISHGKKIHANDEEHLRFQIKRFVQPIFDHFIHNPFGLNSLEEFWLFCDQPVDNEVRLRRLHILESARKLRSEKG
jgi:hypothetical protein